MNFTQYKASIKTKLSIVVAIAVMLVVIALGFYFDNSLKNNSLENAHNRILHGYQRLAYNLKNIENSLKEGIDFIRADEQFPASVELINNYQDKDNYDTYLLDEEKKLIAKHLLNHVKFSFNNDIALYDKNDDLIAFVVKEKNGYQLNYISYVNSQPRLFSRYENHDEFKVSKDLQITPNIPFRHVTNYDANKANVMSLITHHRLQDRIVIKSHQNLIDKDSKELIGHIEMSRILDKTYFLELSQALNLNIIYSFDTPLDLNVKMLGVGLDEQSFNITENKENYSVVLKQNSLDGTVYFLASLNKKNFNLLLNESRTHFFIILASVVFLILLLMRYIINFTLAQPLSVLMKQIDKIEHQDYSESNVILTGDEVEIISANINQLAQTVQEREDSLKTSMQEQKQLASKVKDSQSQLHSLIQTLPDLVWLKDVDGVYLSCNKKFERLFGAKEADIIGKTDYDFVNKELADSFRKNDKAAMAAGKATANEEEITFADDGHTELVETIKTPMFAHDGTLIGVLGVARDITERKQTQEKLLSSSSRLTKLASRLPGMVYQFELDEDGNMSFPYMSDAVEDLYHVTAEEALEDVNKVFSSTHPDDVEKLNTSILESARTFSPWKLEYRIIDKDGSVRWLYGNSIPERKPEGGVMWYGFITDITKSKEMDETIRRTQKMDALGKLTGGIAHDYNNMLGVVMGYAELLKTMLDEKSELHDYVDQIMRAGERGSKLTNKLLSFSRHKTSDAEALNINTALQDERHMLEKILTARIQLELKIEKDIWTVYFDESEFEDAVLNLSINAMHAIEGNGRFVIETSNKTINAEDARQLDVDTGDYVQICFSDNGCGLDEATKDKIFDPFYSTKGEQGTGLGLTQVYGFIKRSGGAIKVDSELGKGTQFILYFPRYISEDVNVSDAEIENPEYLGGHETILMVDDEKSLLKLAMNILSNRGYHVLCAEHAKQALEILENESVDILISDVIMPDMDGYELAEIVQDKYPNIKIQLVSGYSGEKNTNNILTKNILQKPYSAQALLKKIQLLVQ